MQRGVWTAAGTACVAAFIASSAAPVQSASLAVRAAPKGVRVAVGSSANDAPRTYYRAYRPYYSQYYWRPRYYNTIVSDQPFHSQPVPWWATDYERRYAIGPAVGY